MVHSSPEDEAPRRAQMARFAALLFGAASVVTLAGLLFPHQTEVDAGGLVVVVVVAALLAAVLATGGARLPGLTFALVPAAGTILVSLALLFNGERNGGPAGGDEMYYLWVVLYSAYYLGRAATAAHVAFIALAYGATLAAIDPGQIGVSRWLSTIGLVVGTAVVVRLLSERVQRLVDDLDKAARTDRLTGLPNRRAFEQEFAREVARAERTGRAFALLLADLDRFKELNDRYGHSAGDAALAALGHLLPTELRAVDLAARVGGDEFAVLLPDTDGRRAREVAGRLAQAVSERVPTPGPELTLSVGAAVFGADGRTLDDLVRSADEALYAAKRSAPSQSPRTSTPLLGPAVQPSPAQ
jgi:diguanylate cyclase (GGDEF)-like protein